MKNVIITLFAVFVLPIVVLAHPPKKILAEYNTETGILKIEFPHKVKDVNTHYIEKIVVGVNEQDEKVIEYTSQSSKGAHVVELELPGLEKGTVVSVYAKCNKMGSKKGEITIE